MHTHSSPMAAAPLLLLLACGAPAADLPARQGPGIDDTGSESGDAGDDTAGTQADGTDAGWQACDEADLRWTAEVQDQDGRVVDRLAAGSPATLVGRVENPCTQDVVLDVDESCPVLAFELVQDETGGGDYAPVDCPLQGVGLRLRAGEVVEARHSWGALPGGTYELTVHFVVHGLRVTTGLKVD
ncbi:hypothetical protein L6R53_10305 [Myxococcota bacterium]|nr:hypothetical protein [Myxococcota bacterium]